MGMLEELFSDHPWKLLLSTILLNRTRRIQVDLCMHLFLERWPTAEAVTVADIEEISTVIAPLGIRYRRARGLVRFCQEYLKLLETKQNSNSNEMQLDGRSASTKEDPSFHLSREEITGLYHCGAYAADAYGIFIQRNWAESNPSDHALRAFVNWKRGIETMLSK
jgi:hypothetical protein